MSSRGQRTFTLLGEVPDYLLPILEQVSSDIIINKSETAPKGEAYFVFNSEKGLHFVDDELGVLEMDFLQDHVRYQRKGHRGKSELIVKALGLEKKTDLVVDATVGLAADAMFLVQLGFSVIGFERSPVIYLLLQDAIYRWNKVKNDRCGDFEVRFEDATEGILKISDEIKSVYIDPMFPEKKKSALPKKEMQIFKKWVGEDLDGEGLLKAALNSSADRVVVKRPLKAEELLPGAIHHFEGTTVRYDLYKPRKGEGR